MVVAPRMKTKKQTPRRPWLTCLLILFFFSAFVNCPTHSSLQPYLSPPLHAFLKHADPYLAPAKPYAALARNHVLPRASAYLAHAHNAYTTHLRFFVHQYWNRIIKPIYYKRIHPHLIHHSRPYKIYYRRFIRPALADAAARAQQLYTPLAPHIHRFASHTRHHLLAAYTAARPHFLAAYRHIRPHIIALYDHARHYALLFATLAADARRQYVDPHVLRIWEKVAEPSDGISVAPYVTPVEAESAASLHATATSEPGVEAGDPEPEADAEAKVEPDVDVEATDDAESEVETEPEVEPQVETEQEVDAEAKVEPDVDVEATDDAESEVETEPEVEPQVETKPDAKSQLESKPDVEPDPETKSEPEFNSADEQSESDPAQPKPEPASIDYPTIDDFLKDIGLSPDTPPPPSPSPTTTTTTNTPSSTPNTPTRPELTAQKRAALTARHNTWQSDLDALVRTSTHRARAVLAESRGAAVATLVRWADGRGVAGVVKDEAGRLVRGVEGYLVGVEERVRAKGSANAREREMWTRVVQTVESRFRDVVRDVHREVHEWFVGVCQREIEQMNTIAETVKVLADRAQADLGLDYAWLDDVTYYDWQKYHDLMRTSENFTAHIHKIQAQQEPPGTNALVDALNALESEVGGVVSVFEEALGKLRERAEGAGGVFVRADDEEGEGEEEKASSNAPVPVDPRDVFIGRSKEEVEPRLESVSVESSERAGREEL